MSIASAVAQQNQMANLTAAANAAASGNSGATASTGATGTGAGTASTGTSATSGSSSGTGALSQLSGNLQDFLGMLMTQLQNQDPSNPMDTSQFTSELVEFSSVEQQINTNSNLTQLIQLTQSGEILQSSSMVGHQIAVASNQLPVQSGKAELQFTATAAGPVAIAVYNAAGQQIADATVQATVGTNTWNWNGAEADGTTAPDGPYTVAVMGLDASGKATALPFNVIGTATGVQNSGGTLQLELGAENVPFSAVQSIIQ